MKLGIIHSSLPAVILPFVFLICQLSEDMKMLVIKSALLDEHQAWQGETRRKTQFLTSALRSHLAPLSPDGLQQH